MALATPAPQRVPPQQTPTTAPMPSASLSWSPSAGGRRSSSTACRETVERRLRIGSDQPVSDSGWEIDQLAIEGITNTPFPAWSPDDAACNPPLIADAGPDQLVAPDALVTLDGSAPADPDDYPITHTWANDEVPTGSLDDPAAVTPTWTAHRLDGPARLTFQLTVTDDAHSAVDEVEVQIEAFGPDPVEPGAVGLLVGLLGVVWRRRR
ncbi:MAG: hypothetical protein RL071_2482 [Pseudomonadota bacterium]